MMRVPLTLSLYLGRHFLFAILATIGVVLAIVGVIELLELLRRTADAPRNVPFGVIVQMMLLKLPTTAEKIYPFTIMVGSMIALSRLTRSSELVVTRAAGVSVWQFLLPGVVVVSVLGVMFVGIINPIAASTISRFDRLEAKYVNNKPSTLSLLPSGLWLRQEDDAGIAFGTATANEYILHALRMNPSTYALEQVTIQMFDASHQFIGRVDAPSAQLMQGEWVIENAVLSAPEIVPMTKARYAMPTKLTLAQIQDSFSAPETFSFWQLPGFIAVLESSGFSALKHKLHFHSLMSLPVLLAGMLLLAAIFSMRPPRRGRTGAMLVVGLASGFVLYFMTNLIYTLGATGDLPIVLAAWAPSLIVVMAAGAALLHLEDG
jgi:lipopolysaccharide export system permease protein